MRAAFICKFTAFKIARFVLSKRMRTTLSIGIAGCGIGGMAAALMLSKAGHDVTVFDQFSKPEPIGSGLVVQPVGLAVLKDLGLADVVLSRGHKIYKMFGTESDSARAVLNLSLIHS